MTFLLIVLPSLLTLVSFIVIARAIFTTDFAVEEYIEELSTCMVLAVASNIAHLIMSVTGFNLLAMLIDPLMLAVASTIAYRVWEDSNGH